MMTFYSWDMPFKVSREKPVPPLPRIIREGTIGDCPYCQSTTVRRFGWFGKKIGCINPKCKGYYKKFENDRKEYNRKSNS